MTKIEDRFACPPIRIGHLWKPKKEVDDWIKASCAAKPGIPLPGGKKTGMEH